MWVPPWVACCKTERAAKVARAPRLLAPCESELRSLGGLCLGPGAARSRKLTSAAAQDSRRDCEGTPSAPHASDLSLFDCMKEALQRSDSCPCDMPHPAPSASTKPSVQLCKEEAVLVRAWQHSFPQPLSKGPRQQHPATQRQQPQ